MDIISIHKRIQSTDETCAAGGQRWLTTFNDMITLLMVFFVLLFSMGSLDMKRFKNFQNALQSAMGVLNEGRHASIGTISRDSEETARDAEDKRELSSGAQLDHTDGLEAEYTPKGIHLTLDDRLLFASGSARLTISGAALLNKVGRIVKPLKRTIRVEGHTDSVPISNGAFPGNWELSTARAVSVVKYLIDDCGIAPRYLSAAGYGDSKPRAPNDSEINRSRNRRVELIIGQVAEIKDIE